MNCRSPLSRIFVLTLFFILAYNIFLQIAPVRVDVGESNFQSNLILLQAFLFDPPRQAVLIGSSLTGRLLPRYFNGTPLDSVANLGLSGSGPAVGLKLVAQRPAPLVVIEENLLLKPKDANDEQLEEALKSVPFRLSKYARILRAQSRPSAVLYSWIKSKVTQHSEAAPDAPVPPATSTGRGLPEGQSDEIESIKRTVREQVKMLRSKGCQIVFLRMPAGINTLPSSHPACVFADEMCRQLDLAQIDLTVELANRGHKMQYTDGVHLSAASARQASEVLAALLPNISKTAARDHSELGAAEPSRAQ